MPNLIPDLKHAFRALAKKPGFSLAVASALGLGLGLNAAVLGLLDALLLRPFQFPDYERIVILHEAPRGTGEREKVAPANFLDWREQSQNVERLAAWEWWDTTLVGSNEAERLAGVRVSADFFEVFGARPAHGRSFNRADEQHGNHRSIVLGDGLWQRRFAADPALVGKTVLLDGEPFTVVGIAPPGFAFPTGSEVWTPLAFPPTRATDRDGRTLTVAGKLRRGGSLTAAQSEMDVLARRLEQEHPATNRDRGVVVQTLTNAFREPGTGALVGILQAGAAMVLLVACANIAGLLLARSLDRRHEFALRTALGATRGQIVRLLMIETVALGIVASVLALVFADSALDVMRASMPADVARHMEGWDNLRLSGYVVALMPVLAIGVGLVVGVLPAWTASRAVLADALKAGDRSVAGNRKHQRGRRVLVVMEIALALALLITAALMVAGGMHLANRPGGFDPDRLLAVNVQLPRNGYQDADAQRNLAARLLAGLESLPAIERAALTNILPASGWNPTSPFVVEGAPEPASPSAQRPQTGYRMVSPGYFETMQIPLRGRAFNEFDREGTQPVVIVSAAMAQRHWPGQDPIGRRVRIERFGGEWLNIVGVAGDVRMYNWWDGEENLSAAYVPFRQTPFGGVLQVAVRTNADPAAVAGSIRTAVAAVDPLLSVRARTIRQAIAESGAGLTHLAAMMAVCGGIALLLSALGIYSVMAYEISQRTREFGIRIALGATIPGVLKLTMKQAGAMTAIGILLGLAMALALGQVMAGALFGVVPLDAWLFLLASVVLATVALAAAGLAARRVVRLDPLTALRAE